MAGAPVRQPYATLTLSPSQLGIYEFGYSIRTTGTRVGTYGLNLSRFYVTETKNQRGYKE
jgi:hypothetical protein